MKETERIADQLKRAFYGEAWSGPAVMEVLEGVTAEVAAKKPLPDVHSIWELVNHIAAWLNIVRRRVEREIFKVSDSENFPPGPNISESAWNDSLKQLQEAERALRETILRLPESRLDEPSVPGGSSVYNQLHGAVQHSLYHAAQIVLLKRV
jgi:hypothetical protein